MSYLGPGYWRGDGEEDGLNKSGRQSHYDIMNRTLEFGTRSAECGSGLGAVCSIPRPTPGPSKEGKLREAGAACPVPRGSTSAFAPKLPPSPGFDATSRRDKQVVDISPKMAKSCVVSRLISRRLWRNGGGSREGREGREAGGAVRFRSADFGMRVGENASQRLAPHNAA